MSTDKTIKMLLLKLNKQGKEASLIRINKYSEKYGSITTYYKLTFWKKIAVEIDGETKTRNIADTHEFKNARDLIQYMVVKSNE